MTTGFEFWDENEALVAAFVYADPPHKKEMFKIANKIRKHLESRYSQKLTITYEGMQIQ